jgi:hypothetical protein
LPDLQEGEKMKRLIVFLSLLTTCIVYTTSSAQLTKPPSNELTGERHLAGFAWMCLGTFALFAGGCTQTFELTGIGGAGVTVECVPDISGDFSLMTCGNGGHNHSDPPRPLIFDNGSVVYPGDTDSSPLRVSSPVLPGLVFNLWEVPQVAGNYRFSTTLFAPPGQLFLVAANGGFRFARSIGSSGFYNVSIAERGLKQLPARTDNLYLKVRTPETNHVDDVAFGADFLTHQMIPAIAEEYTALSGRTLSINDISLPKGGVFDYLNLNWLGPHNSHREGNDVDINQGVVNQYVEPCSTDVNLRQAVNTYLVPLPAAPPGRPEATALLCESGGRKHIDITAFNIP